MTRIATAQEVAALYASLFQPPTIQAAPGGNSITADYGGGVPIVIQRAAAVPVRRSLHSNR